MNESDADSLRVEGEPRSSARILAAIAKAEDHFQPWQALCDEIDRIYAREETLTSNWHDADYDLLWASMEILKPAIYARPPKPVVSPMFNDRRKLYVLTADLLERGVTAAYDKGGIDEALLCVRDDLILYNRAPLWLSYESDGGQRVCIEHLDRRDFLHAPARKWSEVPWVARRAWLTPDEMKRRFGDRAAGAQYRTADGVDADRHEGKAAVWEVWHKAERRVYWVSPGVESILDEDKPHYDLAGFFPCPRPAYGTLQPRSLTPRPDYIRYEGHFRKINSLTRRIYGLLDMVRMKGLVPAGGDIGEAIEQLLRDDSNTALLIPVPGALISGGSGDFVQWLPIDQIASAIQGLIEARRELFADYDRLSGISDIMRGETDAGETLGAQRLKGQYGSVRVREKCDEIVRLSRDATRIMAEMMAEHFSAETLMDMAQMEIPTAKDIKAEVAEIEKRAEAAMTDAMEKARQAPDQEQAQKALQEAQQQIVAEFGPLLKAASARVPREEVMKLLRDQKARNFAFEVETDSTILVDEAESKRAATEFYQAFTGGMQGLIGAAGMGEEAIRVASEVLKYTLAPYRPPRSVVSAIDEFLDAAPQIAARASASEGEGDKDAMAQLAQAELQKAQAQTMKAQADAELKAAELQGRMQEAGIKAQQDQQRFALEIEQTRGKLAEIEARTQKVLAEIEKMGVDAEVSLNRERREDVKVGADIQARHTDQAMRAAEAARPVVNGKA